VGDRCSKQFFDFHKDNNPAPKIKELIDKGRVIRGQRELGSHATEFYKTLYTIDAQVETNHAARAECLRNLPHMVTEEQNQQLTSEIMKVEIHKVVTALPSNKAPGTDYIPTKFFQIM
jgi:hypothetical protein